MSYFQPEQMEDTSFEAGTRIFDGMLAEITKAEAELAAITASQAGGRQLPEAAVLEAEMKKQLEEKPEDLGKDPEIRYYLAVGKLEEQVKVMRQAKITSEERRAKQADKLRELDTQIKEQSAMVAKLQKEAEGAVSAAGSVEDANMLARKEMNKQVRANKILLSEFKTSLKKFIDKTAGLKPDCSPGEGSPYGYLLQALWQNYLKNGMEYINIQDFEFDVPSNVLNHLLQAGVVRSHTNDKERIRLEDFTCSD